FENRAFGAMPLTSSELKMRIEDLPKLEKMLDYAYRAEPLEGFFLEILKGQLAIAQQNAQHFLWHSFWLLIRKSDRIVVGSADFKDVPNANGEVKIGYGLGKEFEHHGYMTEAIKALCDWTKTQKPCMPSSPKPNLTALPHSVFYSAAVSKKKSERQQFGGG
ncbi:MAG: GNAT family N-acetyltransferase, partial [Ruthenibacterium sp.]